MKIIHIFIGIFLFLILSYTAFGYPNCIYFTVSPAEVQFQLIDPLGNKTGYEPTINGKIENIPNTLYILHEESGLGPIPNNKYRRGYGIEPKSNNANSQLIIGRYQLKLFGSNIIEQYSYDIAIYYEQASNNIRYFQRNRTLIYPNAVWTYEFDVPAVPPANGQIVLIKVSTPNDLIKDLTTAGQLGYIGNPHFISELTKEINEIEAEKAKGKIDDGLTPAQKAKKEYTELLSEITEKYNKPESDEFVKKEAYDVLKEDIEYIISHL